MTWLMFYFFLVTLLWCCDLFFKTFFFSCEEASVVKWLLKKPCKAGVLCLIVDFSQDVTGH